MKKQRNFAILYANDTLCSYDNIHTAISEYKRLKGGRAKNDNVSAVVELDNNNNIMRYIISNVEYGTEMCSHCGDESIMHAEFRAQYCTECGRLILPCHLCDCDYANCEECPLKGNNRKYIGGIKPIDIDYNE